MVAFEPQEVRATVDRLVLEHGSYSPLDLLLTLGFLRYRDLERWRSGRSGALEDVLAGDPPRLRRVLGTAGGYARTLGLEPWQEPCYAWRAGEPGDALALSRVPALDALLCTHYRRRSAPQLDLFFDSAAVVLLRDITGALAQRRGEQAARLVGRLRAEHPRHSSLPGLERLLGAEQRWQGEESDPIPAVVELRRDIVPLAHRLLGGLARDYLVPLWRRAAQRLQGRPFDPRSPDLHASYAAAQALDWDEVCVAVEAEPGWRRQPVLAARRAGALYLLGQRERSLQQWYRLFWAHPLEAGPLSTDPDQPDPGLRAAWAGFCDGPLADRAGLFPAWHLLADPGRSLRHAHTADREAETVESYRLVAQLLDCRDGGGATPDQAEIAVRKQLRDLEPDVFAVFLRRYGG